jgi:hypothetical protein
MVRRRVLKIIRSMDTRQVTVIAEYKRIKWRQFEQYKM